MYDYCMFVTDGSPVLYALVTNKLPSKKMNYFSSLKVTEGHQTFKYQNIWYLKYMVFTFSKLGGQNNIPLGIMK